MKNITGEEPKRYKVKTRIVKGFNGGHQVQFAIGHQTFALQELESEEDWSSEDKAKWYEDRLKEAFNNL